MPTFKHGLTFLASMPPRPILYTFAAGESSKGDEMGSLDELSVEIGRLREGQDRAKDDRDKLADQLGQLATSVNSLTLAVSAGSATIAAMKPALERAEAGSRKSRVADGWAWDSCLGLVARPALSGARCWP